MNNINKDEIANTIRESMLSLVVTCDINDKLDELDNITIKKILACTIMIYKQKKDEAENIADEIVKLFPRKRADTKNVLSVLVGYVKNFIYDAKEILCKLDIEVNEDNLTRIISLAFVIDMFVTKNWYLNIDLNTKVGGEIKKVVKSHM